jgi:TonB-linked SusC/RagA family outer membrane protein
MPTTVHFYCALQKIMRITLYQALLCGIFAQASHANDPRGQRVLDQKITLRLSHAEIDKALDQIEAYTKVKFMYNPQIFSDQKYTFKFQNEALSGVLLKILAPHKVTFEVVNDRIILTRDPSLPPVTPTNQKDAPKRNVSGTVTDEFGTGLPGVSVLLKGSQRGTSSDKDGKYALEIPDEELATAVLVFSFVGFTTQEAAVGNKTALSVQLVPEAKALSEVVVTAFGIAKEKKALTYAVSEVRGEEFVQARDNNIASALTGKVAGVDATQINSGPGGSSRVIIRGNNSLSGSNPNQQPLYVVNGLPINNSNSGASQNTSGLNIDRGDGISMINPDDIESISVLKGGAAAALYGSQAANGVILITTKSGKAQKGVGVEFNSVATMGTPSEFPNFQNQYGQGQNGTIPKTVAEAQASGRLSYGPKVDPSIQYMQVDGKMHPYAPISVKDNIKNFFRNSSDITNTIAFNAGTQAVNGRLSLSDLRSKSMQPNSSYGRQTANLALMAKLGKNDLFVIKSDLQYNIVTGTNRPTVGYAEMNAAWPVYLVANTVDIRNLAPGYNPETGRELAWNPAPEAPNPYFIVNKMGNNDKTKRYIASTSIQLNLTKKLYIMAKGQRDFQYFDRLDFVPIGKNSQPFGALNTSNGNQQITNIQSTINYNTAFLDKFNVTAMAGGNQERAEFVTNNLNGINFVIPNFISLTNLSSITTTATSTPRYHTQTRTGTNSLFASADLDFDRMIFLSFTGRQDWFSTLNPGHNSIFYPSIGASGVLSDLLPLPDKISFLKLRASWARVGSATINAGQVNQTYTISTTNGYNLPSQNVSSSLPTPNLRPLTVTTSEVGFDAKFFHNRLGLDFTYYNKVTTNDIVGVNISEASGFTGGNVNIGKVTNKGVEILLTASPLKSNSFKWDITLNYAYNKSRIVELAPTVAEISLGNGIQGGRIVNRPGLPYGTVMAIRPKTTADGTPIYNSISHFPEAEEIPYGVGNPPQTIGMTNTLRYKSFSLNVLLDGKFGAVGYNNLMFYATRFGLTPATLPGRDNGLQLTGVDQKGDSFSYLWTPANIQAYYNQLGRGYSALYTYKTDFAKVRRVVLNYNIPGNITRYLKLQSASIALVANNLFILYRDKRVKDAGLDPEFQESVSNAQGTGGVNMPRTRTFGANLMLKF